MGQVVNPARTTLTYTGDSGADFHDVANLSARLTRTDNGLPIGGKTVTIHDGRPRAARP